ncbi:stage II sporulation protein AB (anti-sigma F factor) [Desulfonispora thiosulfatigenes DSM 11270]|uniref:Anti-sigma F factor n=1 Tax=Desulfonispora thiosulfatigenes DSM 11270 TaxID=656914 RepID=A0A1W1VNU8_DESTI|nr:anti-sigma F factor [Desulfonispora thiosulfatigenes]SMB95052.1 stage II sporulation protein AB (anti-sigma F factor) [Desulfonispora thiosulfatigenes DSM 11270]
MTEKTMNHVKIEFSSLPENVSLARVLIASLVAQIDTTLNDLEEVKVAVSEAVSNSIIHGYQNKPDGMVKLEVFIKDGILDITIEDSGIGIENVEEAMTPMFSTIPERMGLGFAFMKSFMDSVSVNSSLDQGTKVSLRKKIISDSSCALMAK